MLMVVPGEQPRDERDWISLPATRSSVPSSSLAARVTQITWATEAIDGIASPRKPSVAIAHRSSAARSLEVACRSNASST